MQPEDESSSRSPVETTDGVQLWLTEIAASLLRAGVVVELDEGSYEIVGFGSSGIF